MTQGLYFSSHFVIGYNIEKNIQNNQSNSVTFLSWKSLENLFLDLFLLVNLIFIIYLSKSYANEKVLKNIFRALWRKWCAQVCHFGIGFFFSFQEEERSQAVLSIWENKWGKGSGWHRRGKETYSMNRSSSPSGPHVPWSTWNSGR